MSGGVDSSVAAALLKAGSCPELGRRVDVVGVHIKCYNLDGCGEKDAEDARRVAEQLNIPFYVFDLEKEYKDKVVQYMVDGYRDGLTPNPDVMCNKEIKFGLFLKRALELGADYVATGHYVRVRECGSCREIASRARLASLPAFALLRRATGGQAALALSPNQVLLAPRSPKGEVGYLGALPSTQKFECSDQASAPPIMPARQYSRHPHFHIYTAKDKNKDQSYFLWTLTQKQLKHCLFPIGEYTKPQVRKLAKKFGLITAEKKDSQGICFLGKVNITDFLKQYIPERRGVVLSVTGEKRGGHHGAYFYTIGQRSGLGIGGTKKPLYIADKNTKTNTITVAEGNTHPTLYKKEVYLTNLNFINPKFEIPARGEAPAPGEARSKERRPRRRNSKFEIFCRVRYRQPLAPATLHLLKWNFNRLVFDKPQKFIAPGQSAVFYSKQGELLGGGVIV